MANTTGTSMEVLVLAFVHAPTANWALPELRELTLQQRIRLESVALLTRDEHGKATCVDVTDLAGPESTLLGPFAGALLGALGGPLGEAASATRGVAGGGGTGGVTKRIDHGISLTNLRRLQTHLSPDSSALVLLVERDELRRLRGALAEAAFLSEAEQIAVTLAQDLELLTADLARVFPSTVPPVTHISAPTDAPAALEVPPEASPEISP